jgi:hypothetical protein
VIASGTGGGYDVYARFLARHLPRHIPGNPTIVTQNTPAASGLAATALVHRPFRSTPDTYEIVSEQTPDAGSRYTLVGPAATLQFDVNADGTDVAEANREIPSRWRLVCEQPRPALTKSR